MKKEEMDLSPLERALASLEKSLLHPIQNDLERDGVIQRFEYSFELCWKNIRRLLILEGRDQVSGSPKPLFREAFEDHLIDNIETWFEFLEGRNLTVHTYNENTAQTVYEIAKRFAPAAALLLKRLKLRVSVL